MPSGGSPRLAPRPLEPGGVTPPGRFVDFIAGLSLPEWAIPAALAAFAVRWRLMSADLRLEEMPGRTIGLAVLRGVDVVARTRLLFEAAVLVLLTAAVALLAAWGLRAGLTRGGARPLAGLRRALAPAHALGAVALATVVSEDAHRALALLCAAAVALVIGVATSVPGRGGARAGGPPSVPVALSVAIAAWALAHAVAGFVGRRSVPPAAHVATALAVSLLVALAPSAARAVWRRDEWRVRVAAATLPLVLLPLTPCVAQEVAYSIFLRGGPSLSFRAVSLVVAAGLVIAAVILALRSPRGAASPGRQVARRHVPIALTVLAIVRTWAPAGGLRPLDLFHEGEAALPAHQLVEFGAIPYVDVFPTHGLVVSYVGGLLDWLLTGSVSGDGRLVFTEPLLVAIGTVATYALVRRASGSTLLGAFAAAVLPAWPESYVLVYGVAFFGLIAVSEAAAGAAGASFLRAGLWLLAVTLFRLDAGIMLGSVVLVVAGARAVRVGRERGARPAFREILLPAFGPVAAALAVAAGAVLATRPDARDALGAAREFLSLRFQALSMGIPAVTSPAVPRADSRFVFLLLPAASLLAATVLAVRQLLAGSRWDARDVLVVALFGYNTLLLTRALGRHTEAEAASLAGFTSSFTIVLLLLLALRLGRPGPWLRTTAIGAVLLVVALVPLPGGSLLAHAAARVPLPAAERPARMSSFSPRFGQGAADAAIRALQQFVAERLRPGDRILDLSHEPLLYVALEREFPGYVVPILYAASERAQQQLVGSLGPELRLVVLRDANYWRDVDGVPDALRSYRVYEYVHRRFPWAVRVGPYTVLLAERPELLPAPAVRVPLDALGEQPANHLTVEQDGSAMRLTARGGDPHVEIPVPPMPLTAGDQLAVELELATRASGPFQVFFGARGEPFAEAFSRTFEASGAGIRRLESPPAARDVVVDRLRFDLPEGGDARLERLSVRASSAPVPIGVEERVELFEAGLIPWLWARGDSRARVEAKGAVASRPVSAGVPLTIEPRGTIPLPVGALEPTPDEQVRITIRAEAPGALVVRYGRGESAPAGMAFELVPGLHEYVLRLGAQASWSADPTPVTRLELESRSDARLSVEALVLERVD